MLFQAAISVDDLEVMAASLLMQFKYIKKPENEPFI